MITRILSSFMVAIMISTTGFSQTVEQRVEDLLSQMTLKEKVGQMTQLTVDLIAVGETFNLVEPYQIDTSNLRKTNVEYGVGSLMNISGHD